MPIEVRELVIRATVIQEGTGSGSTTPPAGTNNNVTGGEEMIAACVEKILEILKSKDGR